MVVDMQNSFFRPEGSMTKMGFDVAGLEVAIPGVQTLVEAAHGARVPVIFTRYVYQPGFADGGLQPTEINPLLRANDALIAGSWDAELITELPVGDEDIVIDKSRPSSFYGTRLEPLLTGLGVRSLVICGVTTNICVETTARDAGQRDYRTFVVSDATGELTPERHAHALNTIGFFFGWVVTVEDVLRSWKARQDAVAS